MRYVNIVIILLLVNSCNQTDKEETNKKDAVTINKKTDSVSKKITRIDSAGLKEKDDTALLSLSNEILQSLKTKNYQQLTGFVHSKFGVRFSPYGYVDTLHDQTFVANELMSASKTQKKIHWGRYDGTGDPINLNLTKYFEKFVYDVDFLTAKQRSTNKAISGGASLNNLQAIYPGCDFTEFYFPGFDPKYGGMDWKALRLIFKKDNGKDYLVAIIHDQWRI